MAPGCFGHRTLSASFTITAMLSASTKKYHNIRSIPEPPVGSSLIETKPATA
jgi:hypothetical protein